MSAERRSAIAEVARAHGLIVVEDEIQVAPDPVNTYAAPVNGISRRADNASQFDGKLLYHPEIVGFSESGTAGNDYVTILNVAIPTIQRQLGAGDAVIQWLVAGYASVYGILIMTGGRLGDIYGYRKILSIGLVIFFVGSFMLPTQRREWR